MRIAPKPERIDVTTALTGADRFDIALVVVHGMGNAYKSQILLEWAEPLLERIDWMTRDLAVGAKKDDPRFGVTIAESDLSGAVPIVTATVGVPSADAPDGLLERRIAIVEARWSESFVPMTRRQVFRWAVTFLWRAISRMLLQYGRTVALIPLLRARAHACGPLPTLQKIVVVILDAFRFAAGLIVVILLDVVIVALGVVATVVMPLLSPLLLIPWFKERAQEVIDGIIESIGDVASWKERPLRAAAMRLVFRDALDHAARLVGVDPAAEAVAREDRVKAGEPRDGTLPDPSEPHVQVLAHSQGAAVAAYALFSDTLVPSDYRVLHPHDGGRGRRAARTRQVEGPPRRVPPGAGVDRAGPRRGSGRTGGRSGIRSRGAPSPTTRARFGSAGGRPTSRDDRVRPRRAAARRRLPFRSARPNTPCTTRASRSSIMRCISRTPCRSWSPRRGRYSRTGSRGRSPRWPTSATASW